VSTIEPALTAEEWAKVEVRDGQTVMGVPDDYELPEEVNEAFEILVAHGVEARRIAALCLHEQPFGFTREDVTTLRQAEVVEFFDAGGIDIDPDAALTLKSLADRIEALLPPDDD
tara:strand:+ start:8817 stop:9161 length:345 start_codon:yes stop_codon:yes gene_type:complete